MAQIPAPGPHPPLSACLVQIHGSHAKLRTSRTELRGRKSLLLLVSRGPHLGIGEATPLDFFGVEDAPEREAGVEVTGGAGGGLFEGALEELTSFVSDHSGGPHPPSGARQKPRSEHPLRLVAPSLGPLPALPPLLGEAAELAEALESAAARHAVEGAWLSLRCQELGEPLWLALSGDRQRVPLWLEQSVVLDPLAAEADEVCRQIHEHFMNHITTFKLKCGKDDDKELTAIRQIARLGLPLRLRLDPNLAWSADQAASMLEEANHVMEGTTCRLDFVEDPTRDWDAWGSLSQLAPLAVDEPLLGAEPARAAAAASVVVIKPMAWGGASRPWQLARAARAAGKRLSLSHYFDGPVALGLACDLAFALQSRDLPPGLGEHVGLQSFDDLSPGRVVAGDPKLWRQLGGALPRPRSRAGRFLRAPIGDGLDVASSSSQGRVGLAVIPPSGSPGAPGGAERASKDLSWGDLAERVGLRATEMSDTAFVPLLCEPTAEALVDLLAAWHVGQPVLLLHPALPEPQRRDLVNRAARCSAELRPGDAAIVATSGSSGPPHLVVHTRGSLLAAARASSAHLGVPEPGDRWLLSLPFAHVGGLAVIVRCLLSGATVVLGQLDRDAGAAYLQLERDRIAALSLVPTQLARLLAQEPPASLPALRLVLIGGAACPPALLERARSFGLPVAPTYGMTEMGSQIATLPPSRPLEPGATGPLLPGVVARVDREGRLLVGGPMRCRIYLGEPTPLTEDGLLITNDLAELRPKAAAPESARLRILGRADEVIVSGGENVSPQSVETALCSLPEVELAFVCGVPDPTWGQMIVALWVPHAPAAPGVNLRERLRSEATLAVHAIPKVFLESSELPTLPSGKIDRRRAQTETLRRLGKVRQEG